MYIYVQYCSSIDNNCIHDYALCERLDRSVGGPIVAATRGWGLSTNETYTSANRSKFTAVGGGARIITIINPETSTTNEFNRCANEKWRESCNV
jgi:hypothetical protein